MSSAAEIIPPAPRSPAGELRPMPHGGALRNWALGQAGNPTGRSKRFHEVQQAAREASPEALKTLVELMQSKDERVAIIAANSVLDRAFGKPKEQKTDENQPLRPNLSALPPDMLSQLRAIMSKLVETDTGSAQSAPISASQAQDVVLDDSARSTK